jgi:hypothetical protein
MRSPARSTFHDHQPFKSEWQRPRIDQVDLSQKEIDSITSAADPQAELRTVYLQKKLATRGKW